MSISISKLDYEGSNRERVILIASIESYNFFVNFFGSMHLLTSSLKRERLFLDACLVG